MSSNKNGGKRLLQPLYTDDYVHVPHLEWKLKRLYGVHPTIKTQALLAEAMNVKSSTITGWKAGRQFADAANVAISNPESVPVKRFPEFVQIWSLPESVI